MAQGRNGATAQGPTEEKKGRKGEREKGRHKDCKTPKLPSHETAIATFINLLNGNIYHLFR